MSNEGSWPLIEALSVSATYRETTQTDEFMPSLFLLVGTVIPNQSTPNSLTFFTLYTNRHCRVRFYAFVGQPLSKQL